MSSSPGDPVQENLNAKLTGKQRRGYEKKITLDETIDEESRAELLNKLTESKKLKHGKRLMSDLTKAREGLDPVFLGRRLAQSTRTVLSEQPGRGQTILTR